MNQRTSVLLYLRLVKVEVLESLAEFDCTTRSANRTQMAQRGDL